MAKRSHGIKMAKEEARRKSNVINTVKAMLVCSVILLLISYKILKLSNEANGFFRETKYGRFCLEENICKNNTYVDILSYVKPHSHSQLHNAVIRDTKHNVNGSDVVPNIVHYIWYRTQKEGNYFRFHHMLAVLSAHKVMRPRKIYLWHDKLPLGEYWSEVMEKVPELFPVYRKRDLKLHGKEIPRSEYATCLLKLEIMMEYGGIYSDLDVMVLRPFDQLLKNDVTLGYESPSGPVGIIIGKSSADVFKIWYNVSYDKRWVCNSAVYLANLAKTYSKRIHIENICEHRPNWLEVDRHYTIGHLCDGKTKNYAVRIWEGVLKTEHNAEYIKAWNTTLGEIWRWIYFGDRRLQKPGKGHGRNTLLRRCFYYDLCL